MLYGVIAGITGTCVLAVGMGQSSFLEQIMRSMSETLNLDVTQREKINDNQDSSSTVRDGA